VADLVVRRDRQRPFPLVRNYLPFPAEKQRKNSTSTVFTVLFEPILIKVYPYHLFEHVLLLCHIDL